jgi:hypothetical protein
MIDSIGQFGFIKLSRPASFGMTRLEREVRPGVDGVTVWNTAWRAEPFQLLSVTDCENVGDARATLRAYEQIVGEGPVELWFGNQFDSNVIVHSVVPIDDGTYQTLLGVGGRLGTSFGMLHAAWTLEYWPVAGNQQQQ